MPDVLVLGAGLAGLSAARDLAAAGSDVLVLEARGRVGGRVLQETLDDGRIVQLGGEIVGPAHAAYLGLVDELGLTLAPTFLDEPGETVYDLPEGVLRGEDALLRDPADERDYARIERLFGELVASIDPDDPWSHPDAARLDGCSVGDWLRSLAARPAVIRLLELGALGLCTNSIERLSLLAFARKEAAVGHRGFYAAEVWESLRVAEGSATVALRMADELGDRIRLEAAVRRVSRKGSGCAVELETGEQLRAARVVCALPVGVLSEIDFVGFDEERIASLRRQRMVLAAKAVAAYGRPAWRDSGSSGLMLGEGVLGCSWPQGPSGILSGLVPPERLAYLLATPEEQRPDEVRAALARAHGEAAGAPDRLWLQLWGVERFTRGYITAWAPGDLMAVGPRHGTHAPPLYVCGSDQWSAGYLEGAVRTGRGAARALLAEGSSSSSRPTQMQEH